MVLELSGDELDVLIGWAEEATQGLYAGAEQYLSEDEAALLARLHALRGESGDENPS